MNTAFVLIFTLFLALAAPQCVIDIAYVVDTSPSMTNDISAICSSANGLIATLASSNVDATLALYGLNTALPTTCAVTAPVTRNNLLPLATAANQFPTCYPSPLGSTESWGAGAQILCSRHTWRANALAKVIIAAGDEALCDGDPCDAQDQTSATETAAFMVSNRCSLFALIPTDADLRYENCIVTSATTATAPNGRIYRIRQDNPQSTATDVQNAILAIRDVVCAQTAAPTTLPPTTLPPTTQPPVALPTTLPPTTLPPTTQTPVALPTTLPPTTLPPTTVAPTTAACSAFTGVRDTFCGLCRCFSGYYGGDCATEVSGCTYVPFELLTSKKEHTAAIDQALTGFNNALFNIQVRSGAVELTDTTGRFSVISVGDRSLNAFVAQPTPSFDTLTANSQCRCFQKLTGGSDPATGFCQDIWQASTPWSVLRDQCCTRIDTDLFYVIYDCTLDVVHYDTVRFPPDWEDVQTRNRFSRFPLPLYIRFQREINLTTNVWLFADVEIKAYIHIQQYDRNTNQGQVVIDISVMYPYILALNSFSQQFPDRFAVSYTFGIINEPGRGCGNNAFDLCWQAIDISITPTNGTCNLDNTFTMNFTVSCRSQRCPILTTSQASTQVVAQVNTENFCPAVIYTFPLTGNLSTYLEGFTVATDNFIVYTYIDGGFNANARKFCLKAVVDIDSARVGQGSTGDVITGTFFRSLAFQYQGATLLIYDDSFGQPICPAFTSTECTSGPVAVVIDTQQQYNRFNLGANTAGACFYLTRSNPTEASPLRGLLDALFINWHETPVEVQVSTRVAVVYGGAKKQQDSSTALQLDTSFGLKLESSDPALTGSDSSATSIGLSLIVLFSVVISLFF